MVPDDDGVNNSGRGTRRAAILVLCAVLMAPAPAGAMLVEQELPGVFAALLGQWTGEGTLFGRDARYEMEWSRTLNDSFVHLQFSNGFVGEQQGDVTPVVTASAYYRPDADDAGAASGTWFDTRGVMLPLSASVTADTLTTLWGDATTERGRTTYRIAGPNRVEVTDEVMREGEYSVFARATYDRAQD